MEYFYLIQLTFRLLLVYERQLKVLILLIFFKFSFDQLVCGQLLVCIIAPCCPARLNCLFYVFYCVLSK